MFDTENRPSFDPQNQRYRDYARQRQMTLGDLLLENRIVFLGSSPETGGQAAYNVAPTTVGAYFTKINCFCFTEQHLAPGEKREMAVVFYVDPELMKDSDQDDLNTITLSYTFFPLRPMTRKGGIADSASPAGAERKI